MWYRRWYQFFWRWTGLHDSPIFGFVLLVSSAGSMHRATQSPFMDFSLSLGQPVKIMFVHL